MVSNFHVASLFKVNLVPGSGADGAKLSQAEMLRVRKLCAKVKREVEDDDIQALVDRESQYIGHYENDIDP